MIYDKKDSVLRAARGCYPDGCMDERAAGCGVSHDARVSVHIVERLQKCFGMMYGQGIYRIMREPGGWCVAKLSQADGIWHKVSDCYRFRGWAQNFARRMKLNVVNYESNYA